VAQFENVGNRKFSRALLRDLVLGRGSAPKNRQQGTKNMRSTTWCLLLAWLFFAATMVAGDELTLVREGQSDYLIVVPDRAMPVDAG
jgi:hypothetical protein